MDKLLDKFQIESNARDGALVRCHRQIKEWEICLPPNEPLVMDFGLGRFEDVGLFEFWIANEIHAGYCGKYLFLFDRQMCPRHSHKFKHETFFVVRGTLRVTLDENTFDLEAGSVLAISPGIIHSFAAKKGAAILLELSMPCDPADNMFEDHLTQTWLSENLQLLSD